MAWRHEVHPVDACVGDSGGRHQRAAHPLVALPDRGVPVTTPHEQQGLVIALMYWHWSTHWHMLGTTHTGRCQHLVLFGLDQEYY